MSLFRENRLIYRRASDFGYSSTSDAKVDSRQLAAQVQAQQQANLDAQRAQQEKVNQLNAFEAERSAFAQQNGVDYTPTTYSRMAGTADQGTGIAGTKLDEDADPVSVYKSSTGVTMDRSLPTSIQSDPADPRNPSGYVPDGALVGDQRDMTSAVEDRRNQRIRDLGLDPNSETLSILNQGGRYVGTENGVPVYELPGGKRVTVTEYNDTTAKNASDAFARGDMDEATIRAGIEKEQQNLRKDMTKKETNIIKNDNKQEKTPMTSISEITNTLNQLKGMTAESMGVRQDVFNAFAPLLNMQIAAAEKARIRAEEIDTFEERSAIADEEIQGTVDLAAKREAQFEARRLEDMKFLKENRDIVAEQMKLTGEMLNLDKQIFEEEAKISEIRQLARNVEGEKRLRRSLNALGVENSPESVNFLQTKINEAADALSSMIRTNNLSSLKYTNARQQLDLGLRQALNDFESKRAAINATFDDNIFNLDDFVSGARSAVLEELKTEWSNLIAKEDELMMTAAKTINDMTLKSVETQQSHDKMILDQKSDLWGRLFKQRDQDGNLNPGFTQSILREMQALGVDVSGIDPNAMTESQVNELHRNMLAQEKADRDRSGRQMTPGQTTAITEYDDSLRLLESVKTSMLVDFKDVGGPISSRLGSIPGIELVSESAMRQREFEAQVNLVKQIIGKALEGGVLRKEDEIKYEKILPNLKDTDRIRATKIAELERQILGKKQGLLQNLSLSGYNTSGFDFGDPLQTEGTPRMTDDEAIEVLERLESGEPMGFDGPNAGVVLSSLGVSQTQGFDTPISTNLYSQATIKAWSGQHKGIDVAMPTGTKLPSVATGKVIVAEFQEGWGNTVVIQADDGSEHRYSHLNAINVSKGSKVKRGQVIALSGGDRSDKGSGNSTGPHLDYRVKIGGKYIDPYSYPIS